jgi:hypothetical protein
MKGAYSFETKAVDEYQFCQYWQTATLMTTSTKGANPAEHVVKCSLPQVNRKGALLLITQRRA